MRLIDADKLKQMVELIHFNDTWEEAIICKCLNCIDRQPTVFTSELEWYLDKTIKEKQEFFGEELNK